jgi:hypothetical protein
MKTSMHFELESSLDRWTQAGVLSSEQAARIRESESARAPRHGPGVPILIGLALGGVMLAAGVLLFVAAHYLSDNATGLIPPWRPDDFRPRATTHPEHLWRCSQSRFLASAWVIS